MLKDLIRIGIACALLQSAANAAAPTTPTPPPRGVPQQQSVRRFRESGAAADGERLGEMASRPLHGLQHGFTVPRSEHDVARAGGDG